MNKATELQLLNSSTTPTKGGVALSIALASMGGNCGADINLSKIHSDFITALFSESNSRFLVSISPENKEKFMTLFKKINIYEIGVVNSSDTINFQEFNININELRDSYKKTLHGI